MEFFYGHPTADNNKIKFLDSKSVCEDGVKWPGKLPDHDLILRR